MSRAKDFLTKLVTGWPSFAAKWGFTLSDAWPNHWERHTPNYHFYLVKLETFDRCMLEVYARGKLQHRKRYDWPEGHALLEKSLVFYGLQPLSGH